MGKKKLQPISLRLDEDTLVGLKALAEADDRTLSSYLYRVLRQHLESKKAMRAHFEARKAEKAADRGKPKR